MTRPRARSSFRTTAEEVASIYESGPIPGLQAASPILVVEPEDKLRHQIEDLLARSGYYVLGASEPEHALRLTVGHKPALIVVAESREAGFDGVELTQRIRRTAQGAATPIVYMSETGSAAIPGSGLEGDIISRPIVESELLDVVSRHLGAARDDSS